MTFVRPIPTEDRPMSAPHPTRRSFLKTTAATAAMTMTAKAYSQVNGANERIGLAFLGVGGRGQEHIDTILAMQRANRNSVAPVAVNHLWDGDATLGRGEGRGLYPSARRCGLNVDDRVHVNKDYRRLLDLR